MIMDIWPEQKFCSSNLQTASLQLGRLAIKTSCILYYLTHLTNTSVLKISFIFAYYLCQEVL